MWRGPERGTAGRHCEQEEQVQTQPVQHHGGKLPVALHLLGLLVLRHLPGDHPHLPQDQAELHRGGEGCRTPGDGLLAGAVSGGQTKTKLF